MEAAMVGDITSESGVRELWDIHGQIFDDKQLRYLQGNGYTAGRLVGFNLAEVEQLALSLNVPIVEMQEKIARIEQLLPPADLARIDQNNQALRRKIDRILSRDSHDVPGGGRDY
jgi:hypothetical protein